MGSWGDRAAFLLSGKEELPSTFLVPECPAGRGEEDPVLKHFQIPLSVEAGEPQPQRHSCPDRTRGYQSIAANPMKESGDLRERNGHGVTCAFESRGGNSGRKVKFWKQSGEDKVNLTAPIPSLPPNPGKTPGRAPCKKHLRITPFLSSQGRGARPLLSSSETLHDWLYCQEILSEILKAHGLFVFFFKFSFQTLFCCALLTTWEAIAQKAPRARSRAKGLTSPQVPTELQEKGQINLHDERRWPRPSDGNFTSLAAQWLRIRLPVQETQV